MNVKKVPVVILAGGKGTRLSEKTKTIPKPLLKIGNIPIIQHIINRYVDFGFRRFIIPTGYLGDEFVDYFMSVEYSEDINRDYSVSLIPTGEETQTGGRLLRLRDQLDSTFMLTYGDGLSDVDFERLLDFHRYAVETQDIWATITCVHPVPRFGAVEFNNEGFIYDFGEKRHLLGDWINGGFMVMEPDIFNWKSEGNILDDQVNLEKDIFPVLASTGKLKGFKHEGFWHCIDTLRDLDAANEMYANGDAKWIFGKTKE